VPAAYFQHQCLAKEAESRADWPKVEAEARAALAELLFEAPNYDMLIELGRALCKQGRVTEGRKALQEFSCMANADLGKTKCDTTVPEESWTPCQRFACEGVGSSLNEVGIAKVMQRLEVSKSEALACGA
jgi:hypothetical protein